MAEMKMTLMVGRRDWVPTPLQRAILDRLEALGREELESLNRHAIAEWKARPVDLVDALEGLMSHQRLMAEIRVPDPNPGQAGTPEALIYYRLTVPADNSAR
jgi:hypothetical protein